MKSRLIVALAALTLALGVSCSPSTPEVHEDLSGLPSFGFQGYTYYIHTSIGKYTYSVASEKVSALSSYGYTNWFIPSIDELSEALKYGYIERPDNTGYSGYWSSSVWTETTTWTWMLGYGWYNDDEWKQYQVPLDRVGITLPMIRLRK